MVYPCSEIAFSLKRREIYSLLHKWMNPKDIRGVKSARHKRTRAILIKVLLCSQRLTAE